MRLEEQKCTACEGLENRLSEQEIQNMLRQTPGWDLSGSMITKEFKFSNFVEAMTFANKIAGIAEEQNHHPDMHISWGRVGVDLSTHKVGGLSTNDFILAAKINRLYGEEEHGQSI